MVVDNSQGIQQPLYEIVYVSLASREMGDAELKELLVKAREANQRAGITGLLLYHQREFLQLIEGERQAVQRLFQSIERDPRHDHVDVVWEGPVRRRSFEHWSMAFAAPDGTELRQLPGFERADTPSLTDLPRGEPGRRVLHTLREQMWGSRPARGQQVWT